MIYNHIRMSKPVYPYLDLQPNAELQGPEYQRVYNVPFKKEDYVCFDTKMGR